MLYNIEVRHIMHPGKRKDKDGNSHQEDAIYPSEGQLDNSDRLFVLCDGMGGHDAGEVASETVCQAIGRYINANTDSSGSFSPEILAKAIDSAFDALDAVDTGATRKMGTTMAMLKLYDKGAVIAHIGDSRVYHIRPGKDKESTHVLHRTCDHSLVFDMIKAGIMTEEDARKSPHKNVITKALQPHLEARPKPDITKIKDIRVGDYFYICSDGMIENMDSPELKEIFSYSHGDIDQIRQTLLEQTEDNRDNHTAFIIRIKHIEEPVGEKYQSDEFDETSLTPSVSPPAFNPNRFGNLNKPDDNDDITRLPETAGDKDSVENGDESESTQPNFSKKNHRRPWLIGGIIAIAIAIVAVLVFLIYLHQDSDSNEVKVSTAPPGKMIKLDKHKTY